MDQVQRARIGDEKGVREHLKAWARFTERLAMSAAETMIKASPGP